MGLSLGSNPRIPFSTGLDASKPSTPLVGDQFYATDTAINYQWNGSSWTSNNNLVPIGGVISWLKSYTNTPSIPNNFVECNGQTLSDAGSVYNGQVIPNLNASGGGTQRFLRGSITSGTTGGSETHTHTLTTALGFGGGVGVNVASDGSTGATSTLPSYYEVVWIIRIK